MNTRSRSAVISVVEWLKQSIAIGTILPRERVCEDSVIYLLNVKRHVARDALAELQSGELLKVLSTDGGALRAIAY